MVHMVKECSKCGEVKGAEGFSRNGKYLRSVCRVCDNAKSRQYYKDNTEKVLARTNQWAKDNFEKKYEAGARRRAKMACEDADRKYIRDLYANAREASEWFGVPFEVDHIVSVYHGGLHHEDNLQVLPRRMNRQKGCGEKVA